MRFRELDDTLAAAIAAEKIGTPVALRVHAVVPQDVFHPAALLDAIVGLAETAFQATPSHLTARSHVDGGQWNVLCRYAGGQTLLVSLAASPQEAAGNGLHLLLIGNHGIIRLEGAEQFEPMVDADSTESAAWMQRLQESNAQGAAVTLS